MKSAILTLLATIGLLVSVGWVLVSTLSIVRPAAPPPGSPVTYPWGAMHVDEDQDEEDSDLEEAIIASYQSEPEGGFDPDADGFREYRILILSGGGSAGAFGAGLLAGWTQAGTRPDFKIVTGVSTGSLQATFAFLGSDYDDELTEVFTEYGTEDIYSKRNLFAALLGESALDTAPLANLIATYIDEVVLDAVAAKHASGHRLFVGTANMDTREFIIWDMGAIASSQRADKLERYRSVLLASCSIPVLFPPVYFEVESGGKTYREMHMDGGAQAQLFLRGFMLDLEETLEEAGIATSETETSIYVIRNGDAHEETERHEVGGSSFAIASATIGGVFDLSSESSLFRTYVLAYYYGIDFNLASIPDNLFPDLDPIIFDLDIMRQVYDYAYEQASNGYEWAKAPPGMHPDESLREGN